MLAGRSSAAEFFCPWAAATASETARKAQDRSLFWSFIFFLSGQLEVLDDPVAFFDLDAFGPPAVMFDHVFPLPEGAKTRNGEQAVFPGSQTLEAVSSAPTPVAPFQFLRPPRQFPVRQKHDH